MFGQLLSVWEDIKHKEGNVGIAFMLVAAASLKSKATTITTRPFKSHCGLAIKGIVRPKLTFLPIFFLLTTKLQEVLVTFSHPHNPSGVSQRDSTQCQYNGGPFWPRTQSEETTAKKNISPYGWFGETQVIRRLKTVTLTPCVQPLHHPSQERRLHYFSQV